MMRRIAVRALVLHKGKLLCVRLSPDPTIPEKGTFWCLPGGGLEPEEDLLSGLRREMIEETGKEPVIGNLVYIQQFKDERAEYLEFFFNLINTTDYLQIDLSKTTHGEIEIAEIELIDRATPNLYPTFLQTAPIEEDIQSGKSKYFNNL